MSFSGDLSAAAAAAMRIQEFKTNLIVVKLFTLLDLLLPELEFQTISSSSWILKRSAPLVGIQRAQLLMVESKEISFSSWNPKRSATRIGIQRDQLLKVEYKAISFSSWNPNR